MLFQIKKIILWPKNRKFKPRPLEFELGKVNVISGASRTGKSAIIPIIDYCLGSGKCRIPVNTIRDACDWFGIIVETDMGQKLFARREPGFQKATGDMFVLEAKEIGIPKQIETKNTTADKVKRSLDELAGLTALDFDFDQTGSGFKGRSSFRDLTAFIFQPQNIIANQDVFFYKSDTYEHREKLRTIFPFVLNAITPKIMAKKHAIKQLRRDLSKKKNEYENLRQVSEKWVAEIRAKISDAKELGLIKEEILPNASRENLIDILRKITLTSFPEINVTEETVDEAVLELTKLREEESIISNELLGLRRRLAEMSTLRESINQFRGALQIQHDRLKVSEWLKEIHDANHECPLCGNSLEATTHQLEDFLISLKEIETTAGKFDRVPAAYFNQIG
jgi:hypothetical protein